MFFVNDTGVDVELRSIKNGMVTVEFEPFDVKKGEIFKMVIPLSQSTKGK